MQLTQKSLKKGVHGKANKAWDAEAKKAKKKASRVELANSQVCLKEALKTMPGNTRNLFLNQSMAFFQIIEILSCWWGSN